MRETVTRIESNYMKQYEAQLKREQRRRKRLIRRLVLFSIIALIAVGSMISYHVKQRTIYAEKSEQYEQLKSELTSLQQEEKNLKEEIELLQDEDYVLELARIHYYFSKEGELIFQLPDQSSSN